MKNIYYILLVMLTGFFACNPTSEKDVVLGPLPGTPEFSVDFAPDDSNRVVVKDLSGQGFVRLWSAPGANPTTSKLETDTLYFPKKGTYEVTLYISAKGGNGTASASKSIIIPHDAVTPCSGPIGLLTGDCGSAGKCWKFSLEAGAIAVGPTAGSSEWFRSPANGLVPSQYDDRYCFNFDGNVYDYQNQGFTVNPFNGYVDEAYNPVEGPWQFSPGTGANGVDQIILTHGQFVGTRDSYSQLDIVKLTETELVVRTNFATATGDKNTGGWFEFKFVAE